MKSYSASCFTACISAGLMVSWIQTVSCSSLSPRQVYLLKKQILVLKAVGRQGLTALVGAPSPSGNPYFSAPPWCPFCQHTERLKHSVPLRAPCSELLFVLMASISPELSSSETSYPPPVLPDEAQMSPSSGFPAFPWANSLSLLCALGIPCTFHLPSP